MITVQAEHPKVKEIIAEVIKLLEGQHWTDEPLTHNDHNLIAMAVQATLGILNEG